MAWPLPKPNTGDVANARKAKSAVRSDKPNPMNQATRVKPGHKINFSHRYVTMPHGYKKKGF